MKIKLQNYPYNSIYIKIVNTFTIVKHYYMILADTSYMYIKL